MLLLVFCCKVYPTSAPIHSVPEIIYSSSGWGSQDMRMIECGVEHPPLLCLPFSSSSVLVVAL